MISGKNPFNQAAGFRLDAESTRTLRTQAIYFTTHGDHGAYRPLLDMQVEWLHGAVNIFKVVE